jgi:hypothetical protein
MVFKTHISMVLFPEEVLGIYLLKAEMHYKTVFRSKRVLDPTPAGLSK